MIDNLTKDDLPQSLSDIEEAIGIDNVVKLIKLAGGSSIYIPSENSIIKPIRNKIIKKSFKGSYKDISLKYGISEMQVRNIVNLNY